MKENWWQVREVHAFSNLGKMETWLTQSRTNEEYILSYRQVRRIREHLKKNDSWRGDRDRQGWNIRICVRYL